MSDTKICCKKCNQKSPRNIHNRCVYCGSAFHEKYELSSEEKNERIAELEEANEEAQQQLDAFKEKEKEREKARRKAANSANINNNLF